MGVAALTAAYRKLRGGPYALLPAGELPSVTFPTSPLTVQVHIALGADLTASHLSWNWLDITERVRHDLGISVTVGRGNESGRVNPARCALKVDNNDGYLTRRNPLSPYFGLLSRNTPIWIEVDPGSGFVTRFQGYINEWPTRWADQSGTDAFVTLQCAGIMRRLAQGEILKSPMNRTMSGVTPGDFIPIAYWPFEDGVNATQIASGLSGGTPGVITGTGVTFAAASDLPGSDPLPSVDEGSFIDLIVPDYVETNQWTLQLAIKVGASPASDTTLVEVYTPGGSAEVWRLFIDADTPDSLTWHAFNSAGALIGGTGIPLLGSAGFPAESDFYGSWWFYSLCSFMDGGVLWTGNQFSDVDEEFIPAFGSSTSGTVHAKATRIRIFGRTGVSYGHAALFSDMSFLSDTLDATSGAMSGYSGEMAHERIARLCHETQTPLRSLAAESAQMGPQGSGTLLDVLRECEAADGGVLTEYEFGLRYQALSERYNQPVSLELDFDAGHIIMPAPADDDQRLRNEWTVARPDGSSVTYRDDASVALNGLYDDQATLNVETDTQLADVAAWKVHIGTVDEYRWPGIPIKLHGSPDLIPSWLATPLGSRVTIDNPPAGLPPDQIDLIIEGYTERWDTVSWDVSLNTSPASPYEVFDLDGEQRLDSGSSTLTSDITSGATSLSVTTSVSTDLWTTDSAEMPFPLLIGGEVMTVTAIAGASSPQTFTVTRSVNGVTKAHLAGAEVHVRDPIIPAL